MVSPITSGAIVLGSSGGHERSIVAHDQVFRNTKGKPTDGGLEFSIADSLSWDKNGEEFTGACLELFSPAKLESLTLVVPYCGFCEVLTWGESSRRAAKSGCFFRSLPIGKRT